MLAQTRQRNDCLSYRLSKRKFDLGRGVVVTVGVATLAGGGEQLAVIHAIEQAYVINLRFARQEELNGSRCNVCGVVGENVRQGRVDLVWQCEPLWHDACDCRVPTGVDFGLGENVGHVLLAD